MPKQTNAFVPASILALAIDLLKQNSKYADWGNSGLIEAHGHSPEFKLAIPPRRGLITTQHPDRLTACFESLGDGCEFGNVQRFSGAEPEGLFRFSSLPYSSLLTLLYAPQFALEDVEKFRVFPHAKHREWWIGFRELGIYYHSGRSFEEADAETTRLGEHIRLKSLIPRFLSELELTEKIFLRLDQGRSLDEIKTVFRSLRLHGRESLLWIDQADEPARVGTVEFLEEGLVRGFIEKRSENAAPSPGALATWLTVASQALDILKPAVWNDLIRRIGQEGASEVEFSTPTWPASSIATTAGIALPAPYPGATVVKHILLVETGWDDAVIFSVPVTSLVPGALYVLSAWVWIPADFGGHISLVFPGTPSVRAWPASPKDYGNWQRIATSVRIPEDMKHHYPSLMARGPAGTALFSAGWRFERGVCPAYFFRQ